MPLYDYLCQGCRKVTEVRHGFKEAHAEPCSHCGGPLARVFNPAGIVFKGSGFYITDSRKGGEAKAPAAAGDAKPVEPKAAESKPAESKKSDAA